MSNTIPVQIKLECDNCHLEYKTLKWLPDDHWKELAEVEEKQCSGCGNLMKVVSYGIAETKLSKRGNQVYIEIGDFKERLMMLFPTGKNIEFSFGNLLKLPFFGDIRITGKYGETINKFSFSNDNILMG